MTKDVDRPVLRCLRVSKWYGAILGVNQVTLELRPGITGLVGGNGAGKSTLMRLITGHLRPDIGEVSVFANDDATGVPAWSHHARRLVGYCPDTDAFYEELSGRAFVLTMAQLSGYSTKDAKDRTEAVLEQVGMADRANRRLRGYSKGMRQRIKLAQALLHDPALLVLDEPMSGIDPVGRAELVALFQDLAAQGKCLLVSSHELDELEKLTDHVAVMARGRIVATDTVARLRERLADLPTRVRVDLKKASGEEGKTAATDHRALAALLVRTVPEVLAAEVFDATDTPGVGGVILKARHSERFFAELNRVVLEEMYEVVRLETLDDSTQAVLGHLLGGRAH